MKKRLFSALLVFLMVFAVVAPLQAEGKIDPGATGSITVHKLHNISGTPVSGDGTALTDLPAGTEALEGAEYKITQTHKLDAATGNIVPLEVGDGAYTATKTTDNEGLALFDNLPLGRYLLEEISAPDGFVRDAMVYEIDVPLFDADGELVLDVEENPVYEVHVYPKNPGFAVTKTQGLDFNNLDTYTQSEPMKIVVGKEFCYRVETTVPTDIADVFGENPKYTGLEIVDDLDDRLDYVASSAGVTVWNGNTEITLESTDYSISVVGQKITVSFTAAGIAKLASGYSVRLDFKAQVNATALGNMDSISNIATATFTYKTAADEDIVTKSDTAPSYTEVDPGSITINKVDSSDTSVLAGAEFQLWREDASSETDIPNTSVKGLQVSAQTTDSNGQAKWEDLQPGTYYLVEITAPAGYNKLVESIKIVVIEDVEDTAEIDELNPILTVHNVRKGIMPATGGIGTLIFTALGLAIMAAALVVLLKKKEQQAN